MGDARRCKRVNVQLEVRGKKEKKVLDSWSVAPLALIWGVGNRRAFKGLVGWGSSYPGIVIPTKYGINSSKN